MTPQCRLTVSSLVQSYILRKKWQYLLGALSLRKVVHRLDPLAGRLPVTHGLLLAT